MTGFSNEAVISALGGSLDPLVQAIAAGDIRGAVGIVGCNNPKFQQDSMNVALAKELIKKDILVLVTGCVTTAAGKAGLLVPDAIEMAGPGLKKVCGALGIPPVLHYGSCVDNARISATLCCTGRCPECGYQRLCLWEHPHRSGTRKKAAAIGLYAVSSGIYTHLGHPPNILGSETVTNILRSPGLKIS